MTPSEVYTQVRSQANEPTEGFWSDSEVLMHMSNAETQIAQYLGVIEDRTSFMTVSGTREYALGATVGAIKRLEYDTVKCKAISIDQLDDAEGSTYGGTNSTGTPDYYYRWGNTIGLSPIPDADSTVTVYHGAVPAGLDSTASSWTMPDRYGQYVTPYVLWQMFTKDQQLQEEAAFYKASWENGLSIIRHDSLSSRYDDRNAQTRVLDGGFIE